jgi:hypothetical protein
MSSVTRLRGQFPDAPAPDRNKSAVRLRLGPKSTNPVSQAQSDEAARQSVGKSWATTRDRIVASPFQYFSPWASDEFGR